VPARHLIRLSRLAPFAPAVIVIAAVTGCGSSSSGPATPTIAPARTFELAGFRPGAPVAAGKAVRLAFTIRQPSGQPLVDYRRGSGPHTGVHLIVVRSDLSVLIHRHPPVGTNGRIEETFLFPKPGRYRLVVDAYPKLAGPQRNFQLFRWLTVSGAAKATPLPPFNRVQTVDGYRFTLHGNPRLRAVSPAFLRITVRRPGGTPARFTPWYGALAHAIFFRAGSLDYFHTHVCSPGAQGCTSTLGATRVTGNSTTPGVLTVGVLVPVSGTWRLFLQCQVDGRVLTAPFTLKVT
jgi:hypothetical protein